MAAPEPSASPAWLSAAQVGAALGGLSAATIRRRIAAGSIRAVRVSTRGDVRIPSAELARLLAEAEHPP